MENLLLDSQFNLKIIDFGLSKQFTAQQKDSDITNDQAGTRGYQPPEVVQGKPARGTEHDAFSAAVIVFMMKTQCPPFEDANVQSDSFYRVISRKQWKTFWNAFTSDDPNLKISDDFQSLCHQMFDQDPKQRLNISGLLSHPWTKGAVPGDQKVFNEMNDRYKQMN